MGIGGAVSVMDVDGVRVFVKTIPLADIEQQPENFRSTANIFSLPAYFQYGVGFAGLGAWRELAVHLMTTDWVLSSECLHFPLLYHWRVMPRAVSSELSADQAKDVERQFASWGLFVDVFGIDRRSDNPCLSGHWIALNGRPNRHFALRGWRGVPGPFPSG